MVGLLSIYSLLSAQDEAVYDLIKAGDLSMLKQMAVKNSSILRIQDKDQNTLLHFASLKGKREIAEYLLDNGLEVDAQNHNKQTPLHLAATTGYLEVVKLLVDRGADLEAKTYRGRTPAFVTLVENSSAEIVKYLIEKGTDINSMDSNGTSLLVRACERKYPEIVDLLLDLGVKLPTAKGEVFNLISYAAYVDHPRLYSLLREKNRDIDLSRYEAYLVQRAAEAGSDRILEQFINEGFPVDKANMYGNYAIHLAAKGGHLDAAMILLKHGADVHQKNKLGKTAIHFALDYGHLDMASQLKHQGARDEEVVFPELKGEYLGEKPSDKSKLFAPGIVSIEVLEHSPPCFSKDGKEVFWATDFPVNIMTMKLVDGKWTAPRKASFNSQYNDGEPVFSPDNNRIYFLSERSPDGSGKARKENVWYVDRRENGWSEPVMLSDNVNSHGMHWTISIGPDNSLYYAFSEGGGLGEHDIYRSEFKDGKFLPAENLGKPVNSSHAERTPFISPDGTYLIFSSQGREDSLGLSDLYVSFRKGDGSWTEPQNLGETINTGRHELAPVLSPDGKYLFFLRPTNIYWVSTGVIEELREKAGL